MAIRFQVDPDFYDHPKSIGMSDAATALWVRAGSYSAAKTTDGFIAEHVLALLSKSPEEAADELTRRGLWRRVKGGYRFHQWDHRNLTKARIEDDRTADRDRKRRARAMARNSPVDNGKNSGSNASPQARGHNVRPDAGRTPDGSQADSDRIPGASVSVSVSESVSGSGHDPHAPHAANGRADPNPAPIRCPKHVDDPDPGPCGQCADARKARERWDRDRAAEAALARSLEARRRAEAVRAAIDACRLCDTNGRLPGNRLCTHDPDQASRTGRGLAAARNALRRPAVTEEVS